MSERVVLVDGRDRVVGTAPKADAHRQPGSLHRAISVFVYDSDGRMLLQRRAATKYHFAGLWANAACSHPRPGEPVVQAGTRRLAEEMGLTATLREAGTFVYRAEDPVSGLVEHEFDHVLVGFAVGDPQPDPAEASACQWVEPSRLYQQLLADPARFVPWLRIALDSIPSLLSAPAE